MGNRIIVREKKSRVGNAVIFILGTALCLLLVTATDALPNLFSQLLRPGSSDLPAQYVTLSDGSKLPAIEGRLNTWCESNHPALSCSTVMKELHKHKLYDVYVKFVVLDYETQWVPLKKKYHNVVTESPLRGCQRNVYAETNTGEIRTSCVIRISDRSLSNDSDIIPQAMAWVILLSSLPDNAGYWDGGCTLGADEVLTEEEEKEFLLERGIVPPAMALRMADTLTGLNFVSESLVNTSERNDIDQEQLFIPDHLQIGYDIPREWHQEQHAVKGGNYNPYYYRIPAH